MQAFYAAVLHRAGLTAGLGTPVSDFVASVLSPDGAHWCGGDCAPLLRDSLTTAAQTLAARFGDVPAASAILDRFLHHAEIINITGRSYRLKDRATGKQAVDKSAD